MMENLNNDRLVAGAKPDPASPHHATQKSAQDARGGIMLGHMRWVLGISMVIAIVAMGVVWGYF
jgi:hypothetical protein